MLREEQLEQSVCLESMLLSCMFAQHPSGDKSFACAKVLEWADKQQVPGWRQSNSMHEMLAVLGLLQSSLTNGLLCLCSKHES